MIPLKCDTRSAGIPWITWIVVVGCTGILVRLALLPDESAAEFVRVLGVVPVRLLQWPVKTEQILTLLTASFLHAGWIHLAGNMIYLLAVGPAVEVRVGRLRFLGAYLACGAIGALAYAALNPASTAPLVGASGAIAGILGLLITTLPRTQVTVAVPVVVFVEIAKLPAAFVVGFWFLLQLASAVAPVAAGSGAQIAYTAHLAGFIAGAVMGLLVRGGKR